MNEIDFFIRIITHIDDLSLLYLIQFKLINFTSNIAF